MADSKSSQVDNTDEPLKALCYVDEGGRSLYRHSVSRRQERHRDRGHNVFFVCLLDSGVFACSEEWVRGRNEMKWVVSTRDSVGLGTQMGAGGSLDPHTFLHSIQQPWAQPSTFSLGSLSVQVAARQPKLIRR